MVVILVHWLIHPGREEDFKTHWRRMTIAHGAGLYREILTEIDRGPQDAKFHTFSIGDPFYSTFLNIGMWDSLESFDRAVAQWIPKAKVTTNAAGRQVHAVELETFEFKLRERVVLRVIADRGGQLPTAQLEE